MNKLQNFIQTMPMGFMASKDVAELVKIDRLFPVLVRCGGCRFTCAAQDVEHLCRCIVAGEDYVRDVQLPIGSLERARTWVQEESFAKCVHRAAQTRAAGLLGVVANKSTAKGPSGYHFDETQCGGVYDGLGTVTSDADPGL